MTQRRFTASAQSTAHNFQTLMTEIGATSLHLNQDIIEAAHKSYSIGTGGATS